MRAEDGRQVPAAAGQGAVAAVRAEPGREPSRRAGPAAWLFFLRWTGSARLLAHGLPPALAGLLHPVRRRVRSAAGLLALRWHRSLHLRIIGTTLVISVAVVLVLGIFLVQQIAAGLLNTEIASAKTQTSRAQTAAQDQLSLLGPNANPQSALQSVAESLQAGSGPGNFYDVVLLLRSASSPLGGVTGNPLMSPSIPSKLAESVAKEQAAGQNESLFTMATTLVAADGTPQGPALAVGAPVNSNVQLYYVFPLTQQIQTLQLVQKTLILTGAGLVVLLAVIVSLVTRWVVVPIRQAAQAASRLSAGDLDERMAVRGTDDLAALSSSFNEMATSLQDKLRELEELSKVQRQFVSDVSHELRTPLTTIGLAADVIFGAKDELDPTARRAAELLQSQLERFEILLADLLEISRHDANVATLDAESSDMCALVLRAAADAEQLAARRGTRIVFRLPPDPCIAEVDRRRVERVLRNLLDNAVEHGEGKDVIVTVAGDRDAVAVSVRDHGCGFKPGQQQFVFERFWRADPARARTTGGTGLGLAIALEDTRLHGGWLQAWGEPNKGTVFRLTLPRVVGGQLAGSPLPLVPEAVVLVVSGDVDGVDSVAYSASAPGPAGRDLPGSRNANGPDLNSAQPQAPGDSDG